MVFRRLLKDSAVYGGADFITKSFSFFAFPIVAAELSPKGYGVLELIFTYTALLGFFSNCGLNNAVQRFYWDSETTPDMQQVIVTTGFFAQVCFGVLALLFGLACVPFVLPIIQADHLPLTWIALVSALFIMIFSQWSQYILDVIRLHFAPWRFFFLSTVTRVLSVFMGVLAVVLLGLGLDGLLTAQAFVLGLVLPVGIWLIRKDFNIRVFDWGSFKTLVRFGHPFIYSSFAYWLFGSMDRWMLASMSSVEEVGIYSVAFRFASIVLFISGAFGQAWSPVAIKLRADHPEDYRYIYGQVLQMLLFVMLALGGSVALFSGEIISLIMPSDYLPSALPLAVLCFGIVLQTTQQITALGISIENKTYLFARLAWIAALVNFFGNWLLIPRFGAVGSAFATLLSYLFLTGAFIWYTQKLHPLSLQWLRLILLLAMGTVIAAVSVIFLADGFDLTRVALKLMLAATFIFIGWTYLPCHEFRKIS